MFTAVRQDERTYCTLPYAFIIKGLLFQNPLPQFWLLVNECVFTSP